MNQTLPKKESPLKRRGMPDFFFLFSICFLLIGMGLTPLHAADFSFEDEFAITVSGTITDVNGLPLIGATVLEKGTTNGMVSDLDGKFTLDVTDENAVLVFSYAGFETKEMPVGNQTTFNVELEESVEQCNATGRSKEPSDWWCNLSNSYRNPR